MQHTLSTYYLNLLFKHHHNWTVLTKCTVWFSLVLTALTLAVTGEAGWKSTGKQNNKCWVSLALCTNWSGWHLCEPCQLPLFDWVKPGPKGNVWGIWIARCSSWLAAAAAPRHDKQKQHTHTHKHTHHHRENYPPRTASRSFVSHTLIVKQKNLSTARGVWVVITWCTRCVMCWSFNDCRQMAARHPKGKTTTNDN